MDEAFPVDGRNRVRRRSQRGRYDRETVYDIVDEGRFCHVAFTVDGQPYAIPTIHARIEDTLFLHGSAVNRMLTALAQGVQACVTVTLIDGLVLARSAFHHSMNYRSAVLFGRASRVDGTEEKLRAFEALVERLTPGRWGDTREPSAAEIDATTVIRIPIDQASAKVRAGDPVDDDADQGLDHWAGVVPISMSYGEPRPAADLRGGIEIPPYLCGFR
ncbi:MAG: pyridoxamine 5'-phosphate oxidase family protein [Polyangiales bacterium]